MREKLLRMKGVEVASFVYSMAEMPNAQANMILG